MIQLNEAGLRNATIQQFPSLTRFICSRWVLLVLQGLNIGVGMHVLCIILYIYTFVQSNTHEIISKCPLCFKWT